LLTINNRDKEKVGGADWKTEKHERLFKYTVSAITYLPSCDQTGKV